MKFKVRIILSAFFCLAPVILQAKGREIYDINHNWKFFADYETSSDNAPLVSLPHTWNTDALSGHANYYRGTGNYIKEIDVPHSWADKRVFITCEGASSVTDVFVDGKHAGQHIGAHTRFVFEITGLLSCGRKNSIWIAVNNSPRLDIFPSAGDQNSYGGLFRDVELVVTGKEIVSLTDSGSEGVYVRQKTVTSDKAECEAVVKINGVRDNNNVTAHFAFLNSRGDTVATRSGRVKLSGKATSTVTFPFTVDKPQLWNGLEEPHLYTAVVKVTSEGKVTDSVSISTGLRSTYASPSGTFYLNGRKYPLRGVVVTQDRALYGPAVTARDVNEDFQMIREIGANAVRVLGFCHHPEFYRLCDREGILVWNDFPVIGPAYLTDPGFVDSRGLRENGEAQALEIVRQLYNRPSVVVWGLFSDISFKGDDPSDFVSSLNMAVKREDPSRRTGAFSNEDGDINFITDLIGWNHHFGWREGKPSDIKVWKDMLHSNWKDLRSGVSYGAGGSVKHQADSLHRPNVEGNWHPERWQSHLHEEYLRILEPDSLFWGFFVGNMFDYGAAGRKWGEGNGVNDFGLVTFDRKYRKDAFFLYKANWNTEDLFVHIVEKRWDRRRKRKQNIKVYTNYPVAELFVNGESHGILESDLGMIVWKGVEMRPGNNHVRVVAGTNSDEVRIEITERAQPSRVL